ncbi:glycosyltransferase family 2 protein [Reyranella sp.]|uniref:glycosyltransferase family 2 protein n=1 Tax=Reyranella sp. TaxID=1929291 RepID=UPI003D0A9EB9
MSVGVVIPTYNRAALLPATLDAVLAQTLPPDEIIVVDDGSQDDTDAVLRRYASKVRHVRIANSGDLVARNIGVRATKCDLVAFCDSDDLWRPGFLAAMASLWQAEPKTRCGYADFVTVHDGKWSSTSKFSSAPAEFWRGLRTAGSGTALGWFDEPLVDRLVAFQPFFPSCMVADRAFFLSVGGWDEAVSRIVGTDFATALRMAEHPPLGVVRGAPLVGIRKHGGGFSADVQAMNLGDSRILEHVLATRPSVAPYAGLIRDSIVDRRLGALDTAFARGDFQAVRDIRAMIPSQKLPLTSRAKSWVASLPAPLRRGVAMSLLAAGSATARRRR